MIVRYFVAGRPEMVAVRVVAYVPTRGTQVYLRDLPAQGDYTVTHLVDRPQEGHVEVWMRPV